VCPSGLRGRIANPFGPVLSTKNIYTYDAPGGDPTQNPTKTTPIAPGVVPTGPIRAGELTFCNAPPVRPTDPDLTAVADAWPDLPEHIRAAVLALVQIK